IDLSTETIIPKNPNQNSANNYIPILIDKILSDNNIRNFTVNSYNSQVIKTILNILSTAKSYDESAISGYSTNEFIEQFDCISNQLLESQKIAQDKHHGFTQIKKGSLIQSVLEITNGYIYLLALVDHNKFLDENDLSDKNGLPYEKAAFKSALIYTDNSYNIEKISLTDNNQKISEYWYETFLDLNEAKSDKLNTKHAHTLIGQVISNCLKTKYPADNSNFKNALNSYFFNKPNFKFDDCVDFLFENYEPINPNLDIDVVKSKVKDMASRASFDKFFTIDKKEIKSKLSPTYELNEKIKLKFNCPLDKIKEKIYVMEIDGGEKVLAIESVDLKILKQFNFKNINLE
ncbi:hypothetical protein, partial [Clostridium sp.]|uniref:hypothetical protein n=1 Tax=Clostridium sp. TaxID=1506 RepID=UPI00346410DD